MNLVLVGWWYKSKKCDEIGKEKSEGVEDEFEFLKGRDSCGKVILVVV